MSNSHPHTSARFNPARRTDRTERSAGPGLRTRLHSEAIIAGYIHDISTRRGRYGGAALAAARNASGPSFGDLGS